MTIGAAFGEAELPPPPSRAEMEESIEVIKDNAERLFPGVRDPSRIVTLYNKAMGPQWNASTDLDWSIDVDPERLGGRTAEVPVLQLAHLVGASMPGRRWPSGRRRSTRNWASSSSRPT